MKKIGALFVGLLFLTFGMFADEVITNDTGEDATGLRVAFSSPVLITAFGGILTSVDPQMLAFEFVFSGGVVEPWGSHWMNWAPSTAQIMEYQWLTSGSSGSASPHSSTSLDASAVVWEDIPTILTFNENVAVEYEGNTQLESARFWGLEGSQVKAAQLYMMDDQLFVGIELHNGDKFGNYDYSITLYLPGSARIPVMIRPSKNLVEIQYYKDGDEIPVYTTQGTEYIDDADSAHAVIALGEINEYLDQYTLCTAVVRLELIYHENARTEYSPFQQANQLRRDTSMSPS